MPDRKRFSTFYVGSIFCGVDVEMVQEVVRCQSITRVPLAPHIVRGLINLRGQIVAAIDLRRRLGMSESPPSEFQLSLMVRTVDGVVSLLVDDIGEVVEVEETTRELPPSTVDVKSRELFGGIYKLSDRLMHVLDIEQAVKLAT